MGLRKNFSISLTKSFIPIKIKKSHLSKPRPNVPCRFFIIFFVDHNSTLLHIYKVSIYPVCNYFIHYIKIKAAATEIQKMILKKCNMFANAEI